MKSITKTIASSGVFQIELVEKIGENDHEVLIEISKVLSEEFGPETELTEATIELYFNRHGSLPFIARYRGKIIGYIIGVPLETLDREPWARMDVNFGKNNTLYTYAFVINKKYKSNGYAKMLKRVYLNWARKKNHLKYITGHVLEGISSNFKGNVFVVDRVANWQGTKKVFEYYRRKLEHNQPM
tara:strand:+ start:1216 stop:1770 length:555 start_codon:yes stop_codon:yes gene_type:complete